MNTISGNSLLNGHKSSSSPSASKEIQTKTILSNGSLNGHKSLVTVGAEGNGFSSGAPEQTQRTQGSVPKGTSDSHSESVPNCKNGDFSNPTAKAVSCSKPITNLDDTMSKTDKGISTKDTSGSESSGANGSGDGQNGVVTVKISDLPKMESLKEEKACVRKTHKKAKTFLKCKITSMKFSSNILMGASLNQQKRKKHKRSKRIKNLVQEHLMDEGPSSSCKAEVPKAEKLPIGKDFNKRVDKDGAVLATRDFNGASTSQSEFKEPYGLNDCKKSSLTQKDLVHMLTRGLEDITVPCWDEDESMPSQIRETTRVLSIGYVGDEW